jgi:hypothetical protein
MTALLIAAGGLIVAVIGNAIIDPFPRSRAQARSLLWHQGSRL